jgi:tetratricopeptide (TPR) repeat protein
MKLYLEILEERMANQEQTNIISFTPSAHFLYEQGMKKYQKNELHLAIKFLERAVNSKDATPSMSCQLAMALTEVGEYYKSNMIYHTLVNTQVERYETYYYFMANNYAYLGLFEDAKKYAELYLEHADDEELIEETEELLEVLNIEETEQEYSFDDELIVKQEEANERVREGKFEEAIVLLKAIIRDYPEFWSAQNNLAIALFQLGKMEDAMLVIDELLEKNPGNLHGLCNMSLFLRNIGQIKQSNLLIERLENIYPVLADHRLKLGITFGVVGKYELAYRWLRSLKAQGYDGDVNFYYWLSYAAHEVGNGRIAEKIWETVTELDPTKHGKEPWKSY